MQSLFAASYQGRRVLVTGHTGFKGSWLSLWLLELGAEVIGASLPQPPTEPSHFEAAGLAERLTDTRLDIRDLDALRQVMDNHRPEIVFHLAAQPIVTHAYRQPVETMAVNALGTVNVLEAIRHTPSVSALVAVTTDKVYENQEWQWGYRENDRLGGADPYSASKAMAELAIAAYRRSFYATGQDGQRAVAVASVRAGNVIGGGDFADYRLVPDCLRSLMQGKPIPIRMPESVRPWQHVLEPLSGYLWLGSRLLEHGSDYAQAWNFGPLEQQGVTARALAEELIRLWGGGRWQFTGTEGAYKETGQLRMNWDMAANKLGWRPVYDWRQALAEIVRWFQAFQGRADMFAVGRDHLRAYADRARQLGLTWATGD